MIEGNLVHGVLIKRQQFDEKASHVCWPVSLIEKVVNTKVYDEL